MYLKAWADSGDPSHLKAPYFHPTCYPVYFARVNSDPKTTAPVPKLEFDFSPFSTDISTATDTSIKRFQTAVRNLDAPLVKIIKDHTDTLPDAASKTKWAIDFLRNSWPFMSYSATEQHPIAGSVDDGGVSVSQQTQILFIMAQLTSTDPVISYVNGGRKVIGTSSDPKLDPTKLDSKLFRYRQSWREFEQILSTEIQNLLCCIANLFENQHLWVIIHLHHPLEKARMGYVTNPGSLKIQSAKISQLEG
jgi:hypothetical protein